MIESIYQLGKAIMEGSSGKRAFLESLAKAPPSTKKGKPSIAILKLDTEASTLDVEVRELSQTGDNTVERFLWLGNAASSAGDQDRLTTNGLYYLVSQTLPNLLSAITVGTPLYNTLTTVVEGFYVDIGEQSELDSSDNAATYRRSRRLLNLPKLQIAGPTLEELQQRVREEGTAKGLSKLVANALIEHFKKQLNNDGMLFTLEVNGKLLIDDDEYLTYLENVYVGDVFEGAEVGCCHLSGEIAPVTSNLTRLRFKYYITDKLGFASGATRSGFESNLSVSKEAYLALLVGERFVGRELGFYLAGTSGYILPHFYYYDMTLRAIGDILDVTRDIKKRTDFDLGIEQAIDDISYERAGEYSYSLNLLFYKTANSAFKVIRLIQDIPDYRLGELRRQGWVTKQLGDELFGESNLWNLTLKGMYYLLPVRVTKENNRPVYHSRSVLEFYATLITNGLVDVHLLVQDFMELVRVYRFGNPKYHVSEGFKGLKGKEKERKLESLFLNYPAQSNLLLAFLRDQEQLKEETVPLDYLNDLELNERQQEYLEKLHYSRDQAAMYLLGVLVGEIANAQYRLGEGGKGGKKVILNKLNYQGMPLHKVKQLTTELFNKLRQYKIRSKKDGKVYPLLNARNEAIIAQAQELLSAGIGEGWKLTPSENVYYILSGYTHTTFQTMRKAH